MPLTLQINLTPLDLPQAALILPHQLRIWAPQADEVLLVWDADPGPRYQRNEAYRAKWDAYTPYIDELVGALRQDWPGLRSETFNPKPIMLEDLGNLFMRDGSPLAAKDFRGGPLAAYFFGLAIAAHEHVLHLDADMMFGGQSQSWVKEALEALNTEQNLLCVAPPGGPGSRHPVRQQHFTSRCFLLERSRLHRSLRPSQRDPEELLSQGEAELWVAPYAEMPEVLITRHMEQHHLWRLDLPGNEPGMWSLHPPVPSLPDFQARLPQILAALNEDRIPAMQKGFYDLRPETLASF